MLGRGITPSQLIELAPGGGDTAISGNRVAERPPAPASAGSGGAAAVALPARAGVSLRF